jgi:hypothetical protein
MDTIHKALAQRLVDQISKHAAPNDDAAVIAVSAIALDISGRNVLGRDWSLMAPGVKEDLTDLWRNIIREAHDYAPLPPQPNQWMVFCTEPNGRAAPCSLTGRGEAWDYSTGGYETADRIRLELADAHGDCVYVVVGVHV